MGKQEPQHTLLKFKIPINKIYVKIANIYVKLGRCK